MAKDLVNTLADLKEDEALDIVRERLDAGDDPMVILGDASKASAVKGKVMLEKEVDALVKLIQAVKNDTVTPGLVKEFIDRKQNPKAPKYWTQG